MKKEFILEKTKKNILLIESIKENLENICFSFQIKENNFFFEIYCETCENIQNISFKNNSVLLQKIILSLSKQIKYLENQYLIFFQWNEENIFCINEEIFIFVDEELLEIKNNKLKLNDIFDKKKNCSPELFDINFLPSEIHYKSIYFSIAFFVLKNLTNIKIDLFYQLKKEKKLDNKIILLMKIDEELKKIKYSKLYFFIKKNINLNETKRMLLFI